MRRLAVLAALAAALAAPALARADSHLIGSGPLDVAIAPGSTVEKSMRVRQAGPLGSLGVWVRVAGARANDLTISLVAPDGRSRVLAERQGTATAVLGDGTPGCKGGSAVFNDGGFASLDKAQPPYTGVYVPRQKLAPLYGSPAAGRWTLRIANAKGGVPGRLTCWRLALGLDVDTTVAAASGHTRASVVYRELDYQYSRVQLHIASPGAALDVPLAKVNCAGCASAGPNLLGGGRPLTVRDLDGDGEPEVILDTYTGGAHCCSVSLIFRRVGARYVRSIASWGNAGYRLEALDSLDQPQLVTADDTFSDLFTSFAASGRPILVYQFARGKLIDVTRDFPKQVQADADQNWQAAQAQLKSGGDARGVLAAWAADMANLGGSDEAFRQLDTLAAAGQLADSDHMNTPAGADYVAALRAHLLKRGYLARPK